MKTALNLSVCPLLLSLLAGCASQEPPVIALDEPVEAQCLLEPPKPIEVVEVPKPLALPAQLKPLPETQRSKPAKEPADERVRVSRANREARVAPSREGYINAIQVWPYSDGALYQGMPARVGSRRSTCSLARSWSPWPPATPCAGSSATPPVVAATSYAPAC